MTSNRTLFGRALCSTLLALVWSLGSTSAAWASPPPHTPTPTEAETATPTPTETPIATPTETETPTPVETETPTPTEIETPTPTESETPAPVLTATSTVATATATATLSPTPTGTATPEPLGHFLCYESHQAALNRPGVTLRDQFDDDKGPASTVTVKKAKRLCAPADKADAPSDVLTVPPGPSHLSAYTIHQTTKFQRLGPIPVAPDNNILFPMTVTLTRPSRLLVPAAKAHGTTVPDPLAAPIDHYKCYRVKGARTRLAGVRVKTQFGEVTVDIKKPLELCTPVDKNGEGIVDDVHHLLCYQVRAAAQTSQTVSTNNQFEPATFDIFGIRELCVPAFKFPGFCGDRVFNAPGEECDPEGLNSECSSGVCRNDCTCAPPTCGDDVVNQQSEQCDGVDDSACTATEICTDACACCEPSCPAGACGVVDDGCGGTIDCGGCILPETCGGGGTPNQCGGCAVAGQPCDGSNPGGCCSGACIIIPGPPHCA